MSETLLALVGLLSAATIALLLYIFRSIDKRIGDNTGRINRLEKKVIKIATLIGLTHPEIVKKNSPLQIGPDEDIEQAISRYMTEDEGEENGKCGL